MSVVIWYALRGDVTQGRRFAIAAVIGALAGLTKPGTLLLFIAAMYVLSAAQEARSSTGGGSCDLPCSLR